MFNFNDTTHADKLDKAIADLLEELDALTGSQEDYTTTATNLAKLMELKNQAIKTGNEATKIENDNIKAQTDNLNEREKIQTEQSKIDLDRDKFRLDTDKFAADQETLRSWKPSPDAIVGAAASVIGILFVLHYEKLGVVTSKALGFIGKMK